MNFMNFSNPMTRRFFKEIFLMVLLSMMEFSFHERMKYRYKIQTHHSFEYNQMLAFYELNGIQYPRHSIIL